MHCFKKLSALCAAVSLVSGCGGKEVSTPESNAAVEANPFTWPTSLTVVGDGFPVSGAPCRRIGESAATVDFLDDSAALVGCPTRTDAEKLGGQILKEVDGVTLVSVPNDRAERTSDTGGDAVVPGTVYNATAQISCAGYKRAAAGLCDAGVIRGGKSGVTVEVMLADGAKRVIFFNSDGSFLSFSTAQADGTAALAISSQKKGDNTIAKLGTETYEIPEALVIGG
jgi:hypothetical protein